VGGRANRPKLLENQQRNITKDKLIKTLKKLPVATPMIETNKIAE